MTALQHGGNETRRAFVCRESHVDLTSVFFGPLDVVTEFNGMNHWDSWVPAVPPPPLVPPLHDQVSKWHKTFGVRGKL